MYKEELRKLIIKGVIGFAIGFIFTFCTSPDFGFGGACIIGFFFAGLPYGWQLSGKVVGGWIVIGHIVIMLFAFALRLMIAIMTGWIAYPIALVYYIVKARKNTSIQSPAK